MDKKSFWYYVFRGCLKAGNLFGLLSDFFLNLPTAVISPQKLIDSVNIYFNHERRVTSWIKNSDRGLYFYEEEFIERYNIANGSFLIIASGSSREAFGLAKKGFNITAIDVSAGLIRFSKEKAEREKIKNVDFQCVSMYDFTPTKKFDYIFFSGRSYGYIPTRVRRIEFLKKVKRWMNPDGRFLLDFVMGTHHLRGKRKYFYPIYKVLAYLTFGNREIEKGDVMLSDAQWHHIHTSDKEIISEVKEAGFEIEKFGKERENHLFLKSGNVK